MTEYTPTTEEVRYAYGIGRNETWLDDGSKPLPQFDRWLEAERARIWDEAFCQGASWRSEHVLQNPYKLK